MYSDAKKTFFHKVVFLKSQLYSPPSIKKFTKLSIIPEAGEKECNTDKEVGVGGKKELRESKDTSFSFEISQCDDVRSDAISFANKVDVYHTGIINFNDLV